MQHSFDAHEARSALAASLVLAAAVGGALFVVNAACAIARAPELPAPAIAAWIGLAVPLARKPCAIGLRDAVAASCFALALAFPIREACARSLPVAYPFAACDWEAGAELVGIAGAGVVAALVAQMILRVGTASLAWGTGRAAWGAIALSALLTGGALTTIDRPSPTAAPRSIRFAGVIDELRATSHSYGAPPATSRDVDVGDALLATSIDLSRDVGSSGICVLDVTPAHSPRRAFPLDPPRAFGDGVVRCPEVLVLHDMRKERWLFTTPTSASAYALRDLVLEGPRFEPMPDRTPLARELGVPLAWIGSALAGLVVALVAMARVARTRRTFARALASEVVMHDGAGWLTFVNGRPPLHVPSAASLPRGPLLFRARDLGTVAAPLARSMPYRDTIAQTYDVYGDLWLASPADLALRMERAVIADNALAFAAALVTSVPLAVAAARGLLF